MPASDAPAECVAVHGGGELPLLLLQLPTGELIKITNLMIFSLYCSIMPAAAGNAPAECAPVHRGWELPLPLPPATTSVRAPKDYKSHDILPLLQCHACG